MTFVLALMTAMGPISTDLYVPSLVDLVADLKTTPTMAQWTMSAYLLGFAVGQLFYGPISDKFGRKPVLLVGFAIFLTGAALACVATSIDMLIAARAIQGLGGACPQILARAMVRDLHDGHAAGRQLALMSTIMGVAPVVSPLAGGAIAIWFGWRASFIVMLAVVSALALISAILLPETLREKTSGALSLRGMLASFAIVGRNRIWLSYATMTACCHTGLMTFVSTSPYFLKQFYNLDPFRFGMAFSVCSIAFVTGAAISSRIVSRLGLDGTLVIGVRALAAAGVLQALALVFAGEHVAAIIVPELLFFFGVGLTLPNSVAAALSPFPERAGAASSLGGFFQMLLSSIIGLAVVASLGATAWPLVLVTLGSGLVALLSFELSRGMRAKTAKV